MRYLLASLLAAILLCPSAHALEARAPRGGGRIIPQPAYGAGYLDLTFVTTKFTTSNVDTLCTNNPGFQWYCFNSFGYTPVLTSFKINADGSLFAGPGFANATLGTSSEIGTTPFYRGMGFSGGGYFDAEFSFKPDANLAPAEWPAWWMDPIEGIQQGGSRGANQWLGQAAGYLHDEEVDILEYDIANKSNLYGFTLHDWYGILQTTCPGTECQVASGNTISAHKGIDWNLHHHAAVLWIPATSTTMGSYTAYFDGVRVAGPITFSQYLTSAPPLPPPTTSTPWTFGVGDNFHQTLYVGGGITIYGVWVWQKDASHNITN